MKLGAPDKDGISLSLPPIDDTMLPVTDKLGDKDNDGSPEEPSVTDGAKLPVADKLGDKDIDDSPLLPDIENEGANDSEGSPLPGVIVPLGESELDGSLLLSTCEGSNDWNKDGISLSLPEDEGISEGCPVGISRESGLAQEDYQVFH